MRVGDGVKWKKKRRKKRKKKKKQEEEVGTTHIMFSPSHVHASKLAQMNMKATQSWSED